MAKGPYDNHETQHEITHSNFYYEWDDEVPKSKFTLGIGKLV